MKKFKKAFLITSAIGAIAMPMAAVISCGSSKAKKYKIVNGKEVGNHLYDTENDKTIEIAHTFAATGKQQKALATIVKKYNSLIDDGTLPEASGYYKAKLKVVSGGYGKAVNNLGKDFATKNKKGLANMIIDYPDSAAILQSSRMGLNLNDIFTKKEATAFKDRFDPDFFKQNDSIGGIRKGEIVSVPISVSTMATAVNTPLFYYVISEINRVKPNAIDITDNNPKIKSLYDKGAQSVDDIAVIKNKWGAFDLTKVPASEQANLDVNDNFLNEWDTLIKFVSAAQRGFGKKVNNPNSFHLLGLDSPTNVIQMLSYAYANGDMSKFYITKNSKGYVDYTFLKDKTSNSYKEFEKGIKLIRHGVESGGLFIAGKGAYGSPLLINHQSMFSIGSTAGTTHWYASGKGSYTVDGFSGARVTARNDEIKWAGTTTTIPSKLKSGKHTNAIIAAGATGGKYDYKLEAGKTVSDLSDVSKKLYLVDSGDATASKAFTDAITGAIKVASQGDTKFVYSIPTADASKITPAMKVKELAFVTGTSKTHEKTVFSSHNNKVIEFADKAKASSYDIVLKDGVTSANLSTYKASGFDAFVMIPKDDIVAFTKKFDETKAKEIGFQYDPANPEAEKNGKFYLVKSDPVIKKLSAGETLQESEVTGEMMPTKVKDGQKGAIYTQGPSIIPVHANPGEDKATAKFIDWFTGSNTYAWDANYVKATLTPIMYWMNAAQYIPPIKGAFSSGSAIDQAITKGYDYTDKNGKHSTRKYWMGTKLVFDAFEKAHTDPNTSPLISLVDDFTSKARNNVTDSAIKNIYTNAHTTGNVSSFESIYDNMHKLAKRNDLLS